MYRGEELRLPLNPSGTLVLRPPGSDQGEDIRREEENTLPSRFDRNIEKVYPVLGHRFVATVSIHKPWWWQLFIFLSGLQTFCLLCGGQGVHMGFWETSNLLLLITHRYSIILQRACPVNTAEWPSTTRATRRSSFPVLAASENFFNIRLLLQSL